MELERNFFFASARLLASMEAEETDSWGMQIRGKGRNLGCKMQTTSVSYIYVDTGFERKWENCFNEALRY